MQVPEIPHLDHTPRKMTGIVLLTFFNAYPVADVFGTGHNGGNGFLIPPNILFYLSCSRENSNVARILASREFGPGKDCPPQCLGHSMIHLEIPPFLQRHDDSGEIQTHLKRSVLPLSSVNLQS